MSKLKNIIKQLSEEDFQAVSKDMMESNAEKSAFLLKFLREKHLPDSKVMEELGVNSNAYYTLRSRLNQRIEEYLLKQMVNPRTDLVKKVANIQEIIYTKKRAIAVATLKKLEKELIDYDLSNELTVIYKTLKKLHLNYPEHFYYSQMYNRHIAYMLALDKSEDLLSEYFKKYGNFLLTGDELTKMQLGVLYQEMQNVCKLYDSHRLYVYKSAMSIFHRLFVDPQEDNDDEEAIEDVLANIQKVFEQYYLDVTYYHIKIVFEFLKLEYYNYYKVYKKSEKYYEEVNNKTQLLLSNYSLYTFPPQLLVTKLKRALRLGTQEYLYEENNRLFEDFDLDENDSAKYVIYHTYKALSAIYINNYDEGARYLNNLLNQISLKRYPLYQLEIKMLLLLQYCLLKDEDLFNQLMSSVQRQIRLLGKDNCEYLLVFVKLLKVARFEKGKVKEPKLRALIMKMKSEPIKFFSPTSCIRWDDAFIEKLVI